jgi:hypothetical protein
MGEQTDKKSTASVTSGHSNPLVGQAQSDLLKRLMGDMGGGGEYGADVSSALSSFGATAAGENLGGEDPYFQRNLDRTLSDTKADVNSAFGSSGRYGSNLHAETLADSLGGVRDRAYSTELDKSRDRQVQAAGMLPGLKYGDLSSLAGILGGTASVTGGTSNSTTTTPQPPLWQQLLGYVAGNAGNAMRAGA